MHTYTHIIVGDGYVHPEFNIILVVFMAMVFRNCHQQMYIYFHIPMYLLSAILLLYGLFQQKSILRKNLWLYELDHHPVSTTDQQVGRNIIHFSMVTWMTSLLFDTRIIQFIHCDIVSTVKKIEHSLSFKKTLVFNAVLVATVASSLELLFISYHVSQDWNVLVYMTLAMGFQLFRTVSQGELSCMKNRLLFGIIIKYDHCNSGP